MVRHVRARQWWSVSLKTCFSCICGVTNLTYFASRLVFGVVYWYCWTRLVPHLRGYRFEEEKGVLSDGTTITRLVKIKNR